MNASSEGVLQQPVMRDDGTSGRTRHNGPPKPVSGDSFTSGRRIPGSVTRSRQTLPDTCVTCPHFEFFSRSCGHGERQIILDVLSEDGKCPYYEEIRKEAMVDLESELTSS